MEWAQTIGRLCGREQLKQIITHFGTDTKEELRDYLVVQQRWKEKEENYNRRRRHNHLYNHNNRYQFLRRMNPFHVKHPNINNNNNAEEIDYDDDNVSIPDSVAIDYYTTTRVDL